MKKALSQIKKPLRFLGLDLAGARNEKTTLTALEYFPSENKIFLMRIIEKIGSEGKQSSDRTLLREIENNELNAQSMGVNAALGLPPCITCTRKQCPLPEKCTVASVRWMRQLQKKGPGSLTPYTQRPVELWIKRGLFPLLDKRYHFDVDETLGGTRAPLSARMHFIQRHTKLDLVECSPKLTLSILSHEMQLPMRLFSSYRNLERGTFYRREILQVLSDRRGVFFYDKDAETLAKSLSAFHSFLCAYTALLAYQKECGLRPKDWPKDATWIQYPKLTKPAREQKSRTLEF